MSRLILLFSLTAALTAQASIRPKPFAERFKTNIFDSRPEHGFSRDVQEKALAEALEALKRLGETATKGTETMDGLISIAYPDPTDAKVAAQQRDIADSMEKIAVSMETLFANQIIIIAAQVTAPDLVARLVAEGTPIVEEADKRFVAWEAAIAAYRKKIHPLPKPSKPNRTSPRPARGERPT